MRISLTSLLICALFTAQANAQTGRIPIRVDDPFASRNPDGTDLTMTGEGSLVVTMWTDEREVTFSDDDLWISVSEDGGLSWADEIQVTHYSASVLDVERPSLLVTGGVIHIAYQNDSLGAGLTECVYIRSDDLGQTWTSTVITNKGYFPTLAGDGEHVGIVWQDELELQRYYYSMWSDDGGLTFGSSQSLDSTGRDPHGVFGITVIGDTLYAAFADERWVTDDLHFSSSSAGAPWAPSLRIDLAPPLTGEITYEVQLTSGNGSMQVVWLEDRRDGSSVDRAYARSSQDGGLTWGVETQLTPAGFVDARFLSSDCDGPIGAACWTDDRDGALFKPVRVAVTQDSGSTWSASVALPLLEVGDHKAIHCEVFVDNNLIFVAYEDQSTGIGIPVFFWSNDAGQSWNGPNKMGSKGLGVDDISLDVNSFCMASGGILGAWSQMAMPDPPGIFVAGARSPFLHVEENAGVLTLQVKGADPVASRAWARWAVSGDTALHGVSHPVNPDWFLDLVPDTIFHQSISHPTLLKEVINSLGEAELYLVHPPALPGRSFYWQAWIQDGGRPLGGRISDVFRVQN